MTRKHNCDLHCERCKIRNKIEFWLMTTAGLSLGLHLVGIPLSIGVPVSAFIALIFMLTIKVVWE